MAVDGVHGARQEHRCVHVEAQEFVLVRVEGPKTGVERCELVAVAEHHRRRERKGPCAEWTVAILLIGSA